MASYLFLCRVLHLCIFVATAVADLVLDSLIPPSTANTFSLTGITLPGPIITGACTQCYFVADPTISVNELVSPTNGSFATTPTTYLLFQTYAATASSISSGVCVTTASKTATLTRPVSYEIPSPAPTNFGDLALSFLEAYISETGCRPAGFNRNRVFQTTGSNTVSVSVSAAIATPERQPTSQSDSISSPALRAAISVPIVVVVVLLGLLVTFFFRRRSKQRRNKEAMDHGYFSKSELESNTSVSTTITPADTTGTKELDANVTSELPTVERYELDAGYHGSELRAGEVAGEKEA